MGRLASLPAPGGAGCNEDHGSPREEEQRRNKRSHRGDPPFRTSPAAVAECSDKSQTFFNRSNELLILNSPQEIKRRTRSGAGKPRVAHQVHLKAEKRCTPTVYPAIASGVLFRPEEARAAPKQCLNRLIELRSCDRTERLPTASGLRRNRW